MIEKYIKKKITRKDLEKRMLEGSLQGEYNKYYAKPIIDTLIKQKVDIVEKPDAAKPEVKKEEPKTNDAPEN
jgi:penicillin-binding protein 2